MHEEVAKLPRACAAHSGEMRAMAFALVGLRGWLAYGRRAAVAAWHAGCDHPEVVVLVLLVLVLGVALHRLWRRPARTLRASVLLLPVAFLAAMGVAPAPSPAPVCTEDPGLVWPTAGRRRVTSHYGWRVHPTLLRRRFHNGLDLRARSGTPIRAAGDGVVRVGEDALNGHYVVLDVGRATTISYAHLSEVRVKRGQKVRAGDVLGLSGSTGRSTGPHLHLTTRVRGRSVDPLRSQCWRPD